MLIKFNYKISKNTWFGTGGKALLFFQPKNISELSFFLKFLPKKIKTFVIGLGSNLIIRDGGFNGVVIKLGNNFNMISLDKKNQELLVGGAVRNLDLSKFCYENSVTGFEFLNGIPGSIGGSLFMNAGCFNKTISDNLISFKLIDRVGKVYSLKKNEIKFKYRKAIIPNECIFTEALFKTKKGDKNNIKNKILKITNLRKKNQPIANRTGGSTFENPKYKKAWKLIDEIGYRGKKIGGAMVSEKHSNFMINIGNANSTQLELLGEEIISEVYKKKGIKLKWEIVRLGNFVKL